MKEHLEKKEFNKHVTCIYDNFTEKEKYTYNTSITKGKFMMEKQENTKSSGKFDEKRK